MIKYIFLLFFTGSLLSVNAQTHYTPFSLSEEGVLYLDYIAHDTSLTKEQFFVKSKTWIATAFNDGKEVDVFSDKSEGLIVGKGEVLASNGSLTMDKTYLSYTINIYCKDSKARIVIDRIGARSVGNQFINPNDVTPLEYQYWLKGKTKAKKRTGFKKDKIKKAKAIERVIKSWKDAMNKKSVGYSDF